MNADPLRDPDTETAERTAREAHVRAEHEATHGEAEQCGAECIALGLAEFWQFDGYAITPCPACHCPDHDPGSFPNCPRCELHVDEALIWVARVSREDYDEFVEAIEAEAVSHLRREIARITEQWRKRPGHAGQIIAALDTALAEYARLAREEGTP